MGKEESIDEIKRKIKEEMDSTFNRTSHAQQLMKEARQIRKKR